MTTRDRTVIIVVAVLAAIAAGWLMVVSPQRDKAAKLGSQVTAAQQQLSTAQSQLAAGEVARHTYSRSYTLLARLGEAVPADDNVPSLIYQLQGAASASGVDFRYLNLTPGTGAAAAVAAPVATQAATAALPPGATVGPAGFPTEPFTFSFRGNFFHLASFLGRVQRFVVASNKRVDVSGRLLTLNGISLGPAPKGFPQIDASISATSYIVPAAQGLLGGASPTGPAAAPQSVSTPPSSSPAPAAIASPIR